LAFSQPWVRDSAQNWYFCNGKDWALLNSTDVFIIGGGPAGLAAAIAARQQGFEVVVADGAQPSVDKACGEGFLPDGVSALEALGLRVPLGDGWPFRGIRFLSGDGTAEAPFSSGKFGLAVRRTTLHRLMVERAMQLGAELRWRTPVTGVSAHGVQLGAETVRTRWIVGADGFNSRVRRWAGLDDSYRPRLRYAFRQHYRVEPWTDHMEVYWGEHCQGYATGVGRDQVCVALASHDPNLRMEDGLRALPELSARLKGAEKCSAVRGALTGNRRFHRIARGNIVLIGDASGTVDAITGEGIGLAFRQATVLADCLCAGDFGRYEREHGRMALRPTMMARLMLTLDGRPNLQRRTLKVFRNRPITFKRLVDLHVGALSPLDLAWDGLTLGWGLLTSA
jgi:flavin-dependent dehydrogenase